MHPSKLRFLIILSLLILLAAACSPEPINIPTSSDAPPPGKFESEIIPMTLTGASVIWPEISADTCASSLPAPSIKICLENTSGEAAYPDDAVVSLPAFLENAAIEQVLGALPGGEWLPPHPISIIGIPGVSEGAEGIIIINTNPAPDAAAVGLIIVNGIPVSSDVSSVFIILQNMPDPLSAEGIIIINSKDGDMATVGALTLDFEIANLLDPSQPMSDGGIGLDFNQVAADITQDHYKVSGQVDVTEVYANLKNYHHIPMGIVWGGLITGVSQDQISASPITQGIEWGPPPDDNRPPPDDNQPPPDDSKAAIVWGGMPVDAAGIIIVENVPAPGAEAEGIIIINSKGVSQVMGIIMEDKPGQDSSPAGIVIQNIPPPDDNVPPPDDNKAGIVWGGIVWGGMPGSDPDSESTIIIGGIPAVGTSSAIWTGLPTGFGLPEGMTPMMGEGGFGPMAFGQLSFEGDSYSVPAKEEKCIEIPLSGLVPYLPGLGGDSFPVDSFFDVFIELTVDFPKAGESSRIITPIDAPAYPICTSTPSISTLIPELATPTPTRSASQPSPTPTIRTGLPTAPPGRSAPTKAPTPDPDNTRN